MAYFSVLDLEPPDTSDSSRPGFIWDLNLNQIMDAIQLQSPQYDVSKLYYRFPVSKACAEYRREVYGDVKRADIYECLRIFSGEMREAAAAAGCRDAVKTGLQRKAWHISAVYRYCTAVSGLQAALSESGCRSAGLQGLADYLDRYTEREAFQKCREEAGEIRRLLEELHLILEIEDNKIVITRGRRTGAYARRLGYGEEAGGLKPFLGVPEMSPLEEAIFDTFRKKNPEIFARLEDFAERCPSCADETILRLEQEIQYYLAFYRFEQNMREQGFSFCTPGQSSGREMEGRDFTTWPLPV